MPDLFVYQLAYVFNDWQQKRSILASVSQEVVVLIRKDPNMGDVIDNFWTITLLNTKLMILVKVLAKILAKVMDGIIEEVQTCAIPGSTIHNNFHLIRYNLENVNRILGKGGVLIHLDQFKTFGRVDQGWPNYGLQANVLQPMASFRK